MQEANNDPGFLSFILASLSGAVVNAIRAHRGSYLESLLSVFVGFMVAYWCGPLVADWFGDSEGQHLASIGFLLGLLGKELTTVMVDVCKTHAPAIIAGLLRK